MILIEKNGHYLKGNTHAHSTMSDGRLTPEEVYEIYQRAGYDFLALSDHWHVGKTGEYKNMCLISAAEYDFNFTDQVLHVVALLPNAQAGGKMKRGMDYRDCLKNIGRAGGCAIAAHPAWSMNTVAFLLGLNNICAAEVYNTLSGTPWNAPRADAGHVLDMLCTAGRILPQVAADDCHYYNGEQTRSWTMVRADSNQPEDIIAAYKRGDFYATQGPRILDAEISDTELIVHTTPVSMCTFCSNLVWVDGRCRTGESMTEHVYRLQKASGERYIRCEFTDREGRRAWLSPVEL